MDIIHQFSTTVAVRIGFGSFSPKNAQSFQCQWFFECMEATAHELSVRMGSFGSCSNGLDGGLVHQHATSNFGDSISHGRT